MLPSLVLILLMTAVWSYRNAMGAANHAYDRSLTTAIRAIAENIHVSDGRILADIPYSAMDLIDEGVQERIYYAILGPDGVTLTGYTLPAYLVALGMALGPQLLGHTSYNWSLKHVSPTFVAVVTLGEPVGSAVLAWIFFDESFALLQGIGFVLLLLGIYLAARAEGR